MPLIPVTIRFSPETMDLITRAAEGMDMSVAKFVRGAATVRAMIALNEEPAHKVRDALFDMWEHPDVEWHANPRPFRNDKTPASRS